jgi:hypothetical protein
MWGFGDACVDYRLLIAHIIEGARTFVHDLCFRTLFGIGSFTKLYCKYADKTN